MSSLAYFDGTHLYEHADRARFPPRMEQLHLQLRARGSARFFGSSALFWLEKYHIDDCA